MTVQADDAAPTTGWSESSAQSWLDGGTNESEYLVPWRLACTVAANELTRNEPVVLDVASGPGGFLAVALDLIPNARGIWLDQFAAMESEARRYLSSYEGRVSYRTGDLLDLGGAAPASSVSLVLCSRATHHLEGDTINEFYEQAFALLHPGGWVANLDSMTSPGPWGQILGTARRQLNPGSGVRVPGHPQAHPHTVESHLAGAEKAGFVHPLPIWRFCQHSLVMAQKPVEAN